MGSSWSGNGGWEFQRRRRRNHAVPRRIDWFRVAVYAVIVAVDALAILTIAYLFVSGLTILFGGRQ